MLRNYKYKSIKYFPLLFYYTFQEQIVTVTAIILLLYSHMGNSAYIVPADGSVMKSKSNHVYLTTPSKCGKIPIPLTSNEILIVKRTWTLVKEKWQQICLVAFEKWFTTYPELQFVFRSFEKDLSFREFKENKSFLLHVEKLRSALEILLSHVDQEKKFVKALIGYGKKHHTLGIDKKYATSFAQNLQYGIFSTISCDFEVQNAWHTLLSFTMNILKLGMTFGEEVHCDFQHKLKQLQNEEEEEEEE